MTTVITNLVVALMIVTNGLERVDAVPVRYEPMFDTNRYAIVNARMIFDTPETLWRKTVTTNFVYRWDVSIMHRCPDCHNEWYEGSFEKGLKFFGPIKCKDCDRVFKYDTDTKSVVYRKANEND